MFLDDLIFPQVVSMGEFEGDIERLSFGVINQGGYRSAALAWDRSLRTYQAGLVVRPLSHWREIERFWESCDGAVHGFRLQDPFGNQCLASDGVLWPIDGSGNAIDNAGVGNGGQTYRLFHQVGNALHPKYREIQKPFGTIVVRRNFSPMTVGGSAGQYALGMNTGVVTMVADASLTVTAITVGVTTQITFPSAFSGLTVGDSIYLSGLGGADAALLNNLSHPILGVSGAVYTLGTDTLGKTITAGGTGYKYPQPADALSWSGQFHTPCQFLDTKLNRAVKAKQQGGELLVNTPSVAIVEVPL